MKITKENNELIVRLPLKQKSYDAIGEYTHDTANLIGVIAGNEYSISQLIDLGYKGDQQEGMPIIMFEDREELEKVCKDFDIDIWTLPVCVECNKPIRGCFTMNDKGNICLSCNKE